MFLVDLFMNCISPHYRTYDLYVFGGTIYEKGVEVDPSISRRSKFYSIYSFLTFSQIQLHFDPLQLKTWRHRSKRRILLMLSNSPFATIFSTPFNPFPHVDAFWCFCSRRLFKKKDFLFFDKICSKSSAADLLYERKG